MSSVKMYILAMALVATVLAAPIRVTAMATKALAGPPSEFARMALPDPVLAGITSNAATTHVSLMTSGTGCAYTHSFSVDSTVGFNMALFSPVGGLTLTLVDPNGYNIDLRKISSPVLFPFGDSDTAAAPGTSYAVDPSVVGKYHLTISSPKGLNEINALLPRSASAKKVVKHAYLVVQMDSVDLIFSNLVTYTLTEGNTVSLAARMYDVNTYPALALGEVPDPQIDTVTSAILEAILPDGRRIEEVMHDDGLHNDNAANDGDNSKVTSLYSFGTSYIYHARYISTVLLQWIYGASFTASESGEYVVQTMLAGDNSANAPFVRSAEHLIHIIPRSLAFTGKVFLLLAFGQMSASTLLVNLEVSGDASVLPKVRPYFQLWGKVAATGADVAVAWFSSIETVVTVDSLAVLSLEIDTTWIAKANAVAPFTLRDVYMQDVSTWNPVAHVASIALTLDLRTKKMLAQAIANVHAAGYNGEITLAMRQGVAPAIDNITNGPTPTGGKLVMLHGYCATKNPWKDYANIFTGALFPFRASESVTHDFYAQTVVDFVAAAGLSSFGLIGHSQGGAVSLHLMNFYHSGLDAAVGGMMSFSYISPSSSSSARKIQSMATPFNGNTPAGGVAASLGGLFGLGCGANVDMSLTGAPLWMNTITTTALSQANYYTVQYGTNPNKCRSNTGLIGLKNPNDGTTENIYASLPSAATNHGNTIGECHSDGLAYPAAFANTARNNEMNSAAAR